jgi:hypothetical protein
VLRGLLKFIRFLLKEDGVRGILCLLVSIGWAMAIQGWAPQTMLWLLVGLVPSLALFGVGVTSFDARSDSDVSAIGGEGWRTYGVTCF